MITKLTLQGFKSFNKKISIPFLPGFVVVTGPNGAGKSNIMDAIGFVLGRTSAKSMRAGRLNELIYFGSDKKKPADHTSVSIYFDNSKKAFPSDDKEVYITRKVNQKGVSVFRLNGKIVTREKIIEFLSAARIRPNGYNIVFQGDITQIIETNPIERRLIIDEISGIAEYSEKKAKAMRDLDAVDIKLKEAEIIINERYDIFKRLESESASATKYQNLQKQLQTLKASLAKKKLDIADQNYEKVIDKTAKIEEEIKNSNKDFDQTEKDISDTETEVRQIASKVVDISKNMERDKEASELRTKLLIKKDRLSSNTREIERLNNTIDRLHVIENKQLELAGALPNAVKAVLDASISGVHGIVANLIKIDKKYQSAIEAAAGGRLYNVVVDNEDVAKQCIDYLKREKIGRATFIPLNKIKSHKLDDTEVRKTSGVIGIASDLINFDNKFLRAIDFVFGNTLVVDNLDIAKSLGIGKLRMVTLDGDLVERSGTMIGGYMFRRHEKEPGKQEDIQEYIELRDKLKAEMDNLSREISELETNLQKYSESAELSGLDELEKRRIDLDNRLDSLTERRRLLYEKKLKLQTDLNKLNIQKARIEADLESSKIEVQQYDNIEYIDEKISILEQQVKKVFQELTSIGPINFKAVEEFEKFKTEFESYKVKYEKIVEEKNAVVNMINEIEEKRKEMFYKCMNEISSYFNEVFNKITDGDASLALENPDDLESGLLIKASPPGKKLINIDSLSGGEKALVALSFILSIQKYKPAPFYVLDEIDAAFDKENAEKVATLIKEFSKQAQFIIISHNDTTLKHADSLFGVTMIDGESKIIGLKLPKA